ncbi:sulfatase-like hydrolase/transferase [Streptosporangium sp. NPDC051022]|uniref:sulfatase-like hydrolase/transferase n=1 Tax=Streptosporangium sp. NPDC051022 TaxID=3155752 RepID=UPI00341C7686
MSEQEKAPHDPGVSRRGFGGLAVGAGAVAVGGLLPGTAEASTRAETDFSPLNTRPARRPNILFILADDLGWADLSCYGATGRPTPHLDELARQGLRFTDAYSGSAVCSPTRFSLYTGRYPGRLSGGNAEPILDGRKDGIPPEHPTLASLLGGAGYETAMYGKWHCGFLPDFSPIRSGWQEFFGNFAGGVDYFSHVSVDSGKPDLYEAEVPVEKIGYYTDLLTGRAVGFIERPHRRPWLLNLNYTTPHWPWEGPGDKAESDRLNARVAAGEAPINVFTHRDGGSLKVFAEMVTSLDRGVGSVLEALRRSGQERDTLVVFASDNGGERFSYLWPFNGGKANLYEGGIRVPQIVRWPGVIGRRQVTGVPMVTYDWFPTLLELAGAAPDPAYPTDGVSFASYLLNGGNVPRRDLFWRMRGQGALRRGDYKYHSVLNGGTAVESLFDLATDQREMSNLARREPAVFADLKAAWQKVDAGLVPYS